MEERILRMSIEELREENKRLIKEQTKYGFLTPKREEPKQVSTYTDILEQHLTEERQKQKELFNILLEAGAMTEESYHSANRLIDYNKRVEKNAKIMHLAGELFEHEVQTATPVNQDYGELCLDMIAKIYKKVMPNLRVNQMIYSINEAYFTLTGRHGRTLYHKTPTYGGKDVYDATNVVDLYNLGDKEYYEFLVDYYDTLVSGETK